MNEDNAPLHMTQKLIWQTAKCPVCGKDYRYVKAYKPQTCADYECVHKHLHPKKSTTKPQ